ncbi:hypothetical protein PENSPDRAFT_174829 [Peniophora sp. CONT]|nr:hypothetical protein PENSPDRAFT_174829 [Peniophora sp. CONT]
MPPVYPSSTFSTLPASEGHQSHAPVDALNHTGNFGADNVGASNLHHGHTGHFLPPTSTQFNGHDVIANPAPLQTSSHALMPPLPTPTPPMTAGTSRSSSYTPETPGSVDDWVPPTAEDLMMLMIWIMVPQLTSEQRKYFWLRFNAGAIRSLPVSSNHTDRIQLYRRPRTAMGG